MARAMGTDALGNAKHVARGRRDPRVSAFPRCQSCSCAQPLTGLRFCVMPVEGYPLKHEGHNPRKRKYVFNIWYDFANFADGLYDLELRFLDDQQGVRVHRDQVVVAPPLSEDEYPDSDRLVSVSATDTRSLEEQINSRPSMIRPARRTRFATPPRNVLIQRVDQLGDLVLSIPALRRLRGTAPRGASRRFAVICECRSRQEPRSLRRNHHH